LVDEEKRSRIKELRSSGQIVESQRVHDIPFGVRAIQSGIQVDGIWISNNNTPVPSELGLERSATNGSGTSYSRSGERSKQGEKTWSRQAQSPLRNDYSNSANLLDDDPYGRVEAGGVRPSYKPRKSSHLQYSSRGETNYDDEAVAHLEGQSPSTKKKIYTHRPRGSRQIDLEGDSASAADNEHSSGGSSDSDATLSGGRRTHVDRLNRYSPVRGEGLRQGAPPKATPISGRPMRDSFPFEGAKAEYEQVPLTDSPSYEGQDPFLTPLTSQPRDSYLAGSIGGQLLGNMGSSSNYHPLQQYGDPTQDQFVPGELHLNKQVRKINSGFEVLPAGTFGSPAAPRQTPSNAPEEEFGERRHSRLQKKPRTSAALDRT
jgi:hypothetical protein